MPQPHVPPSPVRLVRFLAMATVLTSTTIVGSTDIASAAAGRELWVERYNGLSAGTDFATDLGVSPDGSTVFVTGGSTTSTEDLDVATIAYAASDGSIRWERRYGSRFDDSDIGSDLAVSPDGSAVFVTGRSRSRTSGDDYLTIAYAASNGARLWVARYTRTPETADMADAIAVSPDSQTVFITGQSSSASSNGYATIAYAAADGTRLWRTVSLGIAQANAMALGPDGTRVFIAGGIQGATNRDYATTALDAASGAKLWNETFNGDANGNDVAIAIGVGPDGSRVFVTGRSDGATTLGNYATVAYGAADGSERWVRGFHARGQTYSSMALAVAPNGSRIVVTGSGVLDGHEQFATVAYGSSGAEAWSDRYDGPSNNFSIPFDVAISGDPRRAVVTGGSWNAATKGYDVATIAYGVTHGSRVWVRRYDGPDGLSDKAADVEIDPSGSKAFVTGDSDSLVHMDDYLTIAYRLR